MSRIGVFGGTFNPPHLGHVAAAEACLRQLKLDRLIIIPAAVPPHKQLPSLTADSQQRMEMARLAFAPLTHCEVSDIELTRGGKSYTCDTLTALHEQYPDARLWLIVGTDMLETFDSWYRPEQICSLARLAAVARSDRDRDKLQLCADRLFGKLGAVVDIVDNSPVEISSTLVRGGETDKLPPAVAKYIRDNCLYIDIDAVRDRVRERLSPKRFAHVLGCEQLASELAEKNGVDIRKARLAALLHDVTKELSLQQQLNLCEKYGIIYDYDSDTITSVIHADTAAAVAKDEFGMNDEICSAVKLHTVGGFPMSKLDKIIYVADCCEPTRTYPGALELRELALRDLDMAVCSAMSGTIENIRVAGKRPYHRTQEALCELLKSRKDCR